MARKIQPRSKVPKPKKGQSSEEYWRERESRQRAINIRDEARTAERINEIFQSMQDSIQQEIESFYQRYADKEGITLTEARGRVSRIDMEQYERLAKKYVKLAHAHGSIKDMAFTDEANDQMRLYNLTMKVNRLEMLKARCGIRAMEGYRDTERLINENLEERAYSEYRRLAGILGNSVQFNENMVRAIVNASYQNATWSQRLWNHQASMSSQIGTQLASGILAGKSSTVLAREIQKLTGGSTYACQRLMRTELRRVQTEAALQSMTDNGVTEYKFMVENGVNPCDECLALDGQVFKLSDMNVGKNAPPMHPQCHCATAPYVDEAKWQRWLDGPAQAGVPWAEFESIDDLITNFGSREIMDRIMSEIDENYDHSPVSLKQFSNVYKDDIISAIQNAPDFIRKTIEKNIDRIFIINENCRGTSCITDKGIRFNIWKDKNNRMGEWASLLHEIGHRIDTLYGDISHTNIFRKALENDFEKTVKSVMIGLNYDRDQAYRYISSILETKVCFSFISDIYGGLSENKCWGGFGHTKKYWGEPNNLTMEAFANFFSAYARRDNLEIDYLQQAFPTATKVFLRIMERIAK